MINKKDKKFIKILEVLEQESTCARLNVAAIIVLDNRIISTGWNGVPSKKTHCNTMFDFEKLTFMGESSSINVLKEEHKIFSQQNELHAEENAIAFAAKNGISTCGSTIFISVSPCQYCAKLILASGIKRVYYVKKYDRECFGLKLLASSNVEVEQIKI